MKNLTTKEIKELKSLTLKGESMMRDMLYSLEGHLEQGSISDSLADICLVRDGTKLIAWFCCAPELVWQEAGIESSIMVYVKANYRQKGLASRLFARGLKRVSKKYKTMAVYPHDKKSNAFYGQDKIKEIVIKQKIKLAVMQN